MTTTSSSIFSAVGGPVDETKVTLSLRAFDLDPDEVTADLGLTPTRAHRRGDLVGRGRDETHAAGLWSYEHKVKAPDEANAALSRLLALLPADDATWTGLRSRYELSLSLTMVVKAWNRGFELDASLLSELARRGLALSCEVYAEPQPQSSACFA